MTFEDRDTRAATTAADDITSTVRRRRAAPTEQPLASRMLDFVNEASAAGGRLGGLALLCRSTFLPGDGIGGADAEMAEAAEIVANCMEAISKDLILTSMNAHEVHNHAVRGGAR